VLVTTGDARSAYLLNASPDLGRQIARSRELAPRARRHTPIVAVVLTTADIDHSLGLLSLREGQPFSIYATSDGVARPSLGDNVGLLLRHGDVTLAYATSVASLDGFARRVRGAACLLFDGTFYASDELERLGIEGARAEDMAHLPIGGEHGSLQGLASLSVGRRIFTHVNNTNPILMRRSLERAAVRRGGWEVAFDGMELLP
jgi:phosphoribosyl 1,2-cyclic phosphodiesterase